MDTLTYLGVAPGEFRQPMSVPGPAPAAVTPWVYAAVRLCTLAQKLQHVHFLKLSLHVGSYGAPLQTGTARPLLLKLPRTSIFQKGGFCGQDHVLEASLTVGHCQCQSSPAGSCEQALSKSAGARAAANQHSCVGDDGLAQHHAL